MPNNATDGKGAISIREATAEDVEDIVALYAADEIGATRERPQDMQAYIDAFHHVARDPGELVVVGCDPEGKVVATLQLSVLPSLSRGGATRAQVEAVHVAASHQGHGAGTTLMDWAVDEARRRGCGVMQLTSDAKRTAAHRFYRRLGFEASHVGFKRPL